MLAYESNPFQRELPSSVLDLSPELFEFLQDTIDGLRQFSDHTISGALTLSESDLTTRYAQAEFPIGSQTQALRGNRLIRVEFRKFSYPADPDNQGTFVYFADDSVSPVGSSVDFAGIDLTIAGVGDYGWVMVGGEYYTPLADEFQVATFVGANDQGIDPESEVKIGVANQGILRLYAKFNNPNITIPQVDLSDLESSLALLKAQYEQQQELLNGVDQSLEGIENRVNVAVSRLESQSGDGRIRALFEQIAEVKGTVARYGIKLETSIGDIDSLQEQARASAKAAYNHSIIAQVGGKDSEYWAKVSSEILLLAQSTATDAEGFAIAAEASATQALTAQTNAGNSASAAASSAVTASTQAANASTSATNASTQAANASSSAAAASSSAILAASVSKDSFNSDPGFDDYPTATGAPAQWASSQGGISTSKIREADPNGGYQLRMNSVGTGAMWVKQSHMTTPFFQTGKDYIIEAEWVLNSGDHYGAGVVVDVYNTSNSIVQAAQLKCSDLGAGVVGRAYSHSVKFTATPANLRGFDILAATSHSTFGETLNTSSLSFRRVSVRPASSEEAKVEIQASAIATLEGRTEAYWEVTAVAGGRAKLKVWADANSGGGVDIEGDTRINGNLLVTGTVNSTQITDNAVTTPWYGSATSVINFAAATKTQILAVSVTKDAGTSSTLEVTAQCPMFGTDAVEGIVSLEAWLGGSAVATRDFDLKVDANGTTYLPYHYEELFSGLAAGTYSIRMYFTRNTGNTCSTAGKYHLKIREYEK